MLRARLTVASPKKDTSPGGEPLARGQGFPGSEVGVPLEGPADGKTALTAWRAATLGSLIVWDLASASCSALLLTLLAWGEALYRPVFLAGWALGGILLLLALTYVMPIHPPL